MTTKDGLTYCVYCYEGFDLGHHAEFHLAECREKRRAFVPMDPKRKEAVVNAVETAIKDYLPGVIIE